MEVEFHPAADEELSAAATYYESRRAQLGLELTEEVEGVCTLISEYPEIGRKVDSTHRGIPLRRFPFVVFYRVQGSIIQITAVAHKRKRPGYWRLRE